MYDSLNTYFKESYPDQEIIVLHGYEIADLDKLVGNEKDVAHWEKDFIIINKTYGYILNIEAKSSLNGRSLNDAKRQLENNRKVVWC